MENIGIQDFGLGAGKGQNYEFHNVENQKEHQKSWRQSLHRKWLLSCF